MNTRLPISPQFAVWGICIIATCWLAASVLFEIHLGLPVTGIQWAKRAVGWWVEFWMLRTLMNGFHRCRMAAAR